MNTFMTVIILSLQINLMKIINLFAIRIIENNHKIYRIYQYIILSLILFLLSHNSYYLLFCYYHFIVDTMTIIAAFSR